MDKLELKGAWNELKGKVKQAYGDLLMTIWSMRREKTMSFMEESSRRLEKPAMKWLRG